MMYFIWFFKINNYLISIFILAFLIVIDNYLEFKLKLISNFNNTSNIHDKSLNNTLMYTFEQDELLKLYTEYIDQPVFLSTWVKYTSIIDNSKLLNTNFSFNRYLSKNSNIIDNLLMQNYSYNNLNLIFDSNNAFKTQFKLNKTYLDLTKTDKIGYVNNPNNKMFFLILTRKNINILNSRNIHIAKTEDIIKLENIYKIKYNFNNKKIENGVLDAGDYNSNYCIEINSLQNKLIKRYFICFESKNIKKIWIKQLYIVYTNYIYNSSNLFYNNETKDNMYKTFKSSKNILYNKGNRDSVFYNFKQNKTNNINQHEKNVQNGEWFVISNWTECSKLCNVGKSYMKRVCIASNQYKELLSTVDISKFNNLFKENAKVDNNTKQKQNSLKEIILRKLIKLNKENINNKLCHGDSLLVKDCNTDKCSLDSYRYNQTTVNIDTNITDNINISNVVDLIESSSLPQKYEKCNFKKGGLALLNKNFTKETYIPVIVSIYNNTLSINSENNSQKITEELKLNLINSILLKNNGSNCFIVNYFVKDISQNNNELTFCTYLYNYVKKNFNNYNILYYLNKEAQIWINIISKFINNCKDNSVDNKKVTNEGKLVLKII